MARPSQKRMVLFIAIRIIPFSLFYSILQEDIPKGFGKQFFEVWTEGLVADPRWYLNE